MVDEVEWHWRDYEIYGPRNRVTELPPGFAWRVRRLAWWERIFHVWDRYLELVDIKTGKVLERKGMFDGISTLGMNCRQIIQTMRVREEESFKGASDKYTYLEP